MKITTLLLFTMCILPPLAFAKKTSPDFDTQYRIQIAQERKALEEAASQPASEAMPKLIDSARGIGIHPDELRLGFNRREVALTAIKKVVGYEEWFRNRLRELIPPGAVKRKTTQGRLKMVPISDQERGEVRHEQHTLFTVLEQLATDEAVRVLADYLFDDRFLYEPGDDYGSSTLAEYAAHSLFEISRSRRFVGSPKNPDSIEWQEWWTLNKASFVARPNK